jgi:parallel beta-helix repeat protein
MTHRKLVFILLPVICLSILGLVRFDVKASPNIIEVPGDYPTIQEAINHANPGDTVSVSAGTYYENLYINKNLTLIGANTETTIINGAGGWCAIQVDSSSVTITGFTIVNATIGIYICESSGCIVSLNSVTTSHTNITQGVGIWLYASNNSVVSDNTVFSDNTVYNVGWRGIVLCGHSSDDTITLNTVRDCGNGIATSGGDNFIYHNNFVDNQKQTEILDSFHNSWNGTNEGNYWSDYNGTDGNQDGIGDIPYVIDANNTDYHPLMGMFSQFEITELARNYTVTTICNSTITNFAYGILYAGAISFNTTGPEGTEGFCRIVIPNALFHNYTILIDGSPPLMQKELPLSNSTYTYVYFTFSNTTHSVIIYPETTMPEFPTMCAILIIALGIPAALIITKRRLKTTADEIKKKPALQN